MVSRRTAITGCHMSLFHTGEQMENEVAPFLEEVRQHGSHEGEVWHMRSDGTVFPAWMSATLLMDDRDVPDRYVGVARDITGQKQAERDLRESEVRFRALVQNLRDVILITDVDGTVLYENPATSAILGYSMMGESTFDKIHPDDVANSKRAYQEAISGTNDDIPHKFRIRHADGSWLIMESLAENLLEDTSIRGMLVMCRDVTLSVKAENEIRESEERFRALLDNLRDIVLVMAPDGTITFENPAVEMTLGYSMLGRNGFDIVHPDDVQLVIKDFTDVVSMTNPGIPTEFRVRHQNGTWIYVDALATNLLDNSAIRGLLVVLRDIDQRVQAQKALIASEVRYRALFDQSPVGVFMFNSDMVLTECNERLAEIMRSPREKLVGLDLNLLKQNNGTAPVEGYPAGKRQSLRRAV